MIIDFFWLHLKFFKQQAMNKYSFLKLKFSCKRITS